LQTGQYRELLDSVPGLLLSQRDDEGFWLAAMAGSFATVEWENGGENLRRFFLALDVLAAAAFEPQELQGQSHQQAYLRSLKRQEADRRNLTRLLEAQGWRVVPVPSLSEVEGGVNYLNGLHDVRHYFLPVYGGLYAALDVAAHEVFRQELTGVEIVPVRTGASQHRAGALHCTFAAYPRSSPSTSH
jgi:hypothetical protein